MSKPSRPFRGLCAALLCLISTPLFAESAERVLLDVLLENKSITPEQHEMLLKRFSEAGKATVIGEQSVEPETAEPESVAAPAPVAVTPADDAVAETASAGDHGRVVVKDGIQFESNDGDFTLKAGGRIHLDAAVYDDGRRELGNGIAFRRARFAISGTVHGDFAFQGEYDFADDQARIRDTYLRYTGFQPASVTAGNFKVPFSLDNQTSSNDITFLERAASVTALTPAARRLGLGVAVAGQNYGANLGAFGETVGGDFDDGDESDSGWSLAGRLTGAPWLSERGLVHLGGSFEYRNANRDEPLRFSTPPESNVTDVRLVDTGDLLAIDDFIVYGAEFATARGPWSLQAERVFLSVNRGGGESDLEFDGWHAQTSFVLTGESRPYDAGKGVFQRIKPRKRYGAVELAARYSTIDLNDADILGGEADSLTAAINWYLNNNVRLSVNYIDVLSLDGPEDGDGDDPSALTSRAQIAF